MTVLTDRTRRLALRRLPSCSVRGNPVRGLNLNRADLVRARKFNTLPALLDFLFYGIPLRFTAGRNKWVGLDLGSAVLIKARFQTPESDCAPVQRHPERRSFSFHFQNISGSQSFVERSVHQCDRYSFVFSQRLGFDRSRAGDQANGIRLSTLQLPFS